MKRVAGAIILFLSLGIAAPALASEPGAGWQYRSVSCSDGSAGSVNYGWAVHQHRLIGLTVQNNCSQDALDIRYFTGKVPTTIDVVSTVTLDAKGLSRLPAFTKRPVFTTWTNDGPDGPCSPGQRDPHHWIVDTRLHHAPLCSTQVSGSA